MPATVADTVIIELDGRMGKLDATLKSAESATSRSTNKMKADFDGAEAAGFRMGTRIREGFDGIRTAATAIAGIAVGSQLLEMAKAGLEYASSLQEVATQTGVTSDTLQEFRFIGTQVGLSMEEMDGSLAMFTRRLGQAATGNDKMLESYSRLGIGIRDASGHVRESGDIIEDLADKISAMKDPAEQAAAAVEFFGRSGMKMLPALQQGGAGINAMREAAHKLGVVMTSEMIAKADDAADTVAKLALILKTQLATAVAQNSGGIIKLANSFATLISFIGAAEERLVRFQRAFKEYQANAKVTMGLTSGVQAEGIRDSRRLALDRKADQYEENFNKAGLGRGDMSKWISPTPRGGGVANVDVTPKGGGAGKAGGAGGAGAGKSAADIAKEYADQVASSMRTYTQARIAMSLSAEEEAELQSRLTEITKLRADADLKANKDLNAVQRKDLSERIAQVRDVELESIEFNKQKRLEQERTDYMQTANGVERDQLQAAYDAARTNKERREIGLALVSLETELRKALLEQVTHSKTASEAMKQRAQLELDNLPASEAAGRARVNRDTAGPLEEYSRKRTSDENRELAERAVVEELDHVKDGVRSAITSKLGIDDPLINSLLDMLLENVLFKPLAAALNGASSGGGGGLFGSIVSGIGSIFGGGAGIGKAALKLGGKAGGGAIQAGKPIRVGEAGEEVFVPDTGGTMVTNSQLRGMAGGGNGGGVVEVHIVSGEMFEARTRNIAGDVSIKTVKAAMPTIMEQGAAHTMGQMQRTTM